MDRRMFGTRLEVDIGPPEPHIFLKIGTGAGRGKTIGLKIESADRNTFLAHGLLVQRRWSAAMVIKAYDDHTTLPTPGLILLNHAFSR